MKQADAIILGSPVYTANVSANMQAFLERAAVVTDMNRTENLLKHKAGAAVTAARRGGALNALDARGCFKGRGRHGYYESARAKYGIPVEGPGRKRRSLLIILKS